MVPCVRIRLVNGTWVKDRGPDIQAVHEVKSPILEPVNVWKNYKDRGPCTQKRPPGKCESCPTDSHKKAQRRQCTSTRPKWRDAWIPAENKPRLVRDKNEVPFLGDITAEKRGKWWEMVIITWSSIICILLWIIFIVSSFHHILCFVHDNVMCKKQNVQQPADIESRSEIVLQVDIRWEPSVIP
jgi:hypothetical protein